MKLPYYQVDAFSCELFKGNPAGVCLLDQQLSDATLLNIAAENNLSETAYLLSTADEACYELRWFTPTTEVDLCGHATLAAAFIVFEKVNTELQEVKFLTQSGELLVQRSGKELCLFFPARPGKVIETPALLCQALGIAPQKTVLARDLMVVLESEEQLLNLQPDLAILMKVSAEVDCWGIIATAQGNDCDFVSRFFAPGAGIDEDPVTGSAHCTLTPYWAKQLGKSNLTARQLSQRTGELRCEQQGETIRISGQACLYLEGMIYLDD